MAYPAIVQAEPYVVLEPKPKRSYCQMAASSGPAVHRISVLYPASCALARSASIRARPIPCRRRIVCFAEHHGSRRFPFDRRDPKAFPAVLGPPGKLECNLFGVGDEGRSPPVFFGVEALVQIGDVLFFAGTIGANDGGHDKTPEDQKFFRHPPSVRTDRKPS